MKSIILFLLSLSLTTGYTLDDAFRTLTSMYLEDERTLFVNTADEAYFDGRTLRGNAYSFRITNYEVLEVGHPENNSETPIMVFYYDTYVNENYDNSKPIVPDVLWPLNFTAYQDNDPNMMKSLDYGSYSGNRNKNGSATVKPGGKVSAAYAYALTDAETPVTLVAGNIFGTMYGKHDFELNKVSKMQAEVTSTTVSVTEVTEQVSEVETEPTTVDNSAEAEYWSNLARQYGLEAYSPYGGSLEEYAAYVQSYIDSMTGYEIYSEDENGVLYENPIYDGRDGHDEEIYYESEVPVVTEPPITEAPINE